MRGAIKLTIFGVGLLALSALAVTLGFVEGPDVDLGKGQDRPTAIAKTRFVGEQLQIEMSRALKELTALHEQAELVADDQDSLNAWVQAVGTYGSGKALHLNHGIIDDPEDIPIAHQRLAARADDLNEQVKEFEELIATIDAELAAAAQVQAGIERLASIAPEATPKARGADSRLLALKKARLDAQEFLVSEVERSNQVDEVFDDSWLKPKRISANDLRYRELKLEERLRAAGGAPAGRDKSGQKAPQLFGDSK